MTSKHWACLGAGVSVAWAGTVAAAWLNGYLHGQPAPPGHIPVSSRAVIRKRPPKRRRPPSAPSTPASRPSPSPASSAAPTLAPWPPATIAGATGDGERSAFPLDSAAYVGEALPLWSFEGTGFFISTTDGTFEMTAAHMVVGQAHGVWGVLGHTTEFQNGAWQPSQWSWGVFWPAEDVASTPATPPAGYTAAPAAPSLPPPGTVLCAVGNNGGFWQSTGSPQVACGPVHYVTNLGEAGKDDWPGAPMPLAGQLQVTVPMLGGFSGSPVFDGAGQIVGVAVAGIADTLDYAPLGANGQPVAAVPEWPWPTTP